MIGKKFMATKIEAPKNSPSNIASFFQQKITQINTSKNTAPEEAKPINAQIKAKEAPSEDKVLLNPALNQEDINNS